MKKRVVSILLALALALTLMPITGFASAASTVKAVANSAEFVAALADPNITVIYLTKDIELDNNPNLKINPNKTALLISSQVPGATRTITQFNSNDVNYAIQFGSSQSAVKDIGFSNVNVIGKNKNGFVYIPDSPQFSEFTAGFDTMTYTGPSLITARQSSVAINSCIINLEKGFNNEIGYVANVKNIAIGSIVVPPLPPFYIQVPPKATTITKNVADAKTLFNISKDGNIAIMKQSIVNVNNTAAKSGFVNFETNNSSFGFDEKCSFTYNGVNGFVNGADMKAFGVGPNSNVTITVTGNLLSANGLMGIRTAIGVDVGSTLKVLATSNKAAYPVIKIGDLATFAAESPKEVLIYNSYGLREKKGLALQTVKRAFFIYKQVKTVEYWRLNSAAPTALSSPPSTYNNATPFNAFIAYENGDVEYAEAPGYKTPLTFMLKPGAYLVDTNVFRLRG